MSSGPVITVETVVKPTEDIEILKRCLTDLFPGITHEMQNGTLRGSVADLEHMKDELERLRMRDSARAHLLSNLNGNSCTFELSKEAATVGRVNFATGMSPAMGTIRVRIEHQDVQGYVESITIEKEKGEEVEG